MQRIDFFQLERPIQERFVASARGGSPPAPLATHRQLVPRDVLGWAALAVASLLALPLLGSVGYGELDSGLALQARWLVVPYALCGAVAVFSAIRAIALHLRGQTLPYAPGVYLFPSGLVDTRGRAFVVRPLADLRRTKTGARGLTVSFADGFRQRFHVPDRARAQELERLLGEYAARQNPDAAPVSAREIAAWDPLKDNGFRNPFSPSESIPRPRLRFRFIAPLAALVVGPLLGYGVFALRNLLAEDALYYSARAEDTREAYRAYVARGGKRPEISEILLPRSELAEVVAKNDLAALERYALSRKNSVIWPEIERALLRALLAELDRVKALGTRAALREFQQKYGHHALIAPQIERAAADHRSRVLAKFAADAKPAPEVLDFFRRLLVYTDEHGPKLELRYRRRLADSVARTETQLRKSVFFGGEASLPAQYFDAARSSAREAELTKLLVEHFGRAFPRDMLSLEAGAPLADDGDELPTVTVPTLLVSHRTEMSGAYLSTQPRAAYTGIGVLFRVSLQIPGDEAPHQFRSSSWQAPALREIRNGASFESIYGEMADKAFAKLSRRYLDELFPAFTR